MRREASRHFREKRGNISKTNMMRLERIVRSKTLETCIEEEINFRGVANLKVNL
jgi:hypothetical protein